MNLPDTTTAYFWPGLAPYQEHDRHLFYGRGDEIFDLSRKVISSRLAILFGPSGAGKTSLLQAGVFPKLREQNLLPVPIRLDFPKPGELIIPVINQIERSLQREAAKQGVSIDPVVNNWFAERKSLLSLWEWLRSFTLTDSSGQTWTPVFIFDQFEEIFTLGKHALGLESFLHQLGDAAENFLPGEINHLIDEEKSELPFNPAEQPYKMVIALREDYFAQLQSLRQILPGVTVRQNHFSLIRLIGTQALEAITGPAPSGMITNQVATEIIHFVANASERTEQDNPNSSQSLDQFEVEPAILSLVCQQLDLKRQAQDQTSITVDFVKQSKGQILEEFYESAMKPVQTETRYYIENQLLDAEGFRTSEPESNLARQLIPPEDIQLLINLRLLHRVEHYQRSHLELSHDVLAPVVKTIRDSRLQREDLEKRKAENTLLRKQRRRSMVLVGSFGIITLLALVAVFFGMQKQKQALRLEKESRIKYFLSESNRLLETNKPLAEAFTANAFLENDQKANPDLMRNVLSQINHPLFNYRESNVIGDYSRFISPEGYGKLYGITNYGSIVEITNNGIPINEILFNNEIILTAFFEKGTIKSLLTSATAPPYKLYMRTHSGEKIRDWDFEPTFLRKRYGIGYSTPLQSSAKVKMSNRDGTKIFISNYTSYWYLNLTGGTFQRLKNSEIVDHVLIEPKPLFFNGEACLFYGDTIIFPDRSDWKTNPVPLKLDKAFMPDKLSDNKHFYSTSYNREGKQTNYYSFKNDRPYLYSRFDKEIISDYLGDDYHFLLTSGNEILIIQLDDKFKVSDTIKLVENFKKVIYADRNKLFLQTINGDIKIFNRIEGSVSSHIQNVNNFPTCSVTKITDQKYLFTFTNSYADPYETVNEPVLITLPKDRIKIKSGINVAKEYLYEVNPESFKVSERHDSSQVYQINSSDIYFDYSPDSKVYLTVSVNNQDTSIYNIFNNNELVKTFRLKIDHFFTFPGENSYSFGTPPELGNSGEYFYTTSNPFVLYKLNEGTSLTLSMTYPVSEWLRQTRHYRYFSGKDFEYLLTYSATSSGSCFDLLAMPDTNLLMHRDYDHQMNLGFACTADYIFISHGDSVSGYNIHTDKEEWTIILPRILEIEFDTLNNILVTNNGTDIFVIDFYGNVVFEKKQIMSFSYFSKNKYFEKSPGKWCFINKDRLVDTLFLPDYYSKDLVKRRLWNMEFLELSGIQSTDAKEIFSDWSDIVDKQKVLPSFETGHEILINGLRNDPPPMFYFRTRQAYSYFGQTDDLVSFVKRFGFDLLRDNLVTFENYSKKSGISQLAEYGILHDRGHADEYYKLLFKYDNKRAEELIQKIGFINDSIKKMFYQSAFNYYFIEKGNFTSALELYKKAKLANVTLEGRYLSWRLLLNGEKKEALLRVKDEFSAGPEDEMNMANYFLMLWVNGYNNEALDFYGKLNNQSIIINILLDSKILVVNRNKSAVKGGFTAEIESFKQFCKFEKMKLEKTK